MRSARTARSRCTRTAIRSASCPFACARCRVRSRCSPPRAERRGPSRAALTAPGLGWRTDGSRSRRSSRSLAAVGRDLAAARRRRHERSRQGADAPRSRRDRRARRAAAARQRADLGDERQDHDRRDGRRRSSSARDLARAQPGGREHGRRDRDDAARRGAPGGAIAGELGLFEVDELWLGAARRASCARARSCSATCSATSSTATASSTRSLSAGRGVLRSARERAAGAERRRSADRRPRPRAARTSCTSACEDRLAGARGDGARGGRQALPPLRRALRLRRGLPRPSRPLPLPELRPVAAAPRPSRPAIVHLQGVRAARFTLHTPAGRAEVSLALPGLYNVYNALAAAALASALEVPLESIVAGLDAHAGRLRARRDA